MKTFSVKNFEKFQHYKDRAPPWIKLYNGLLEDYEFGGLPDASKMHLIAIWLLASRSDNKIPYDPKWVSNRINATEPVDLALLAKRGFIVLDQGEEQYGSEMLAECLTREEGETEERKSKAEPRSPSAPGVSEDFENLKKVYPRRKGNYGWKAAERKFNSLVKTGVDPKAIIASARRLGETLSARVGTEYIPMPASWLNSEDFLDLAVTAFQPNCDDGLIEVVNQDQLDAWDAYGRQVNGRTYPRNKKGGWRFPSKWPPGYEANLVAGVEKILTGRGVQ
ncbi:hypothetical protein [Bradyrhizobium elkanii]|uniref:hypothetical protein n=1 Tax=Bradyrhizobium elkanii TaxID=29448 RepID=UPI001448EC25|nr:hypothetical protein [Bradyrhizobium elkanii]MCP1932529.1 hypothetical protein [Bradyrhizobium elkanii]MCS3479544.1 hypothetical protein [Bradyrhizobium elkanii]MCS3576929.1 hypothetical protein [Bradyrhizobium elkanii]MCS3719806.1 hypothetical protein [Bradyrhizobium elkanii]MCS4004223.1 hypothetical protein [Bradyrhizobium elkanii USDA 61]